ncbi:hypothetical protein [Streptomyces osmaniensis]|uniref:Uncharacterized protein n=1 Tax=Streptomyces osmaniensis TaxID=593134 RepID=A0ABP6Z4L6_9ACTN|nr:hypothetical protein KJK32_05015 [Streptomyces sp. JCM17656]
MLLILRHDATVGRVWNLEEVCEACARLTANVTVIARAAQPDTSAPTRAVRPTDGQGRAARRAGRVLLTCRRTHRQRGRTSTATAPPATTHSPAMSATMSTQEHNTAAPQTWSRATMHIGALLRAVKGTLTGTMWHPHADVASPSLPGKGLGPAREASKNDGHADSIRTA